MRNGLHHKKQKPENVETTSKKGGGKLSEKLLEERNGAIARRVLLEVKEKQKDFSDKVSGPASDKRDT